MGERGEGGSRGGGWGKGRTGIRVGNHLGMKRGGSLVRSSSRLWGGPAKGK